VVWPDLIGLLPEMIHHLEEPSDPIAACMYHAAALARRHVKVVLTGDGGDELFAGFDRYFGFRWIRYYAALPTSLRRLLLGPLLRRLPDSSSYKNLTQKLRWIHDLSFHEGGRRYAEATVFFRFGDESKVGLFTEESARRLGQRDATECIVREFDAAEAAGDLDRMLHADVATRLSEHSLMLTDRMTMAQGLEGRSPFLDHRLAETVATLPVDLKLRSGRLKYLLRRVSEPYLPASILRRPKQGFMFPLGYWMKGPLVPVLRHLVESSCLVEAGIFRRDAMSRLLEEHLADRADHHVRLWMLLNVEIWYRMFLLGETREQLAETLEERVGSPSSH
jgi:asparagine synthase (glutamine-hydrolysing)